MTTIVKTIVTVALSLQFHSSAAFDVQVERAARENPSSEHGNVLNGIVNTADIAITEMKAQQRSTIAREDQQRLSADSVLPSSEQRAILDDFVKTLEKSTNLKRQTSGNNGYISMIQLAEIQRGDFRLRMAMAMTISTKSAVAKDEVQKNK